MGADALRGNGITLKILFFFRDKALTPRDEALHKVRKSRILLFVVVQLVGFGAPFAITQTMGTYMHIGLWRHFLIKSALAAAIGFPVIILLLVPLRVILVPRLPFTNEELAILDGPTASPFVSVLSS